MDTVAQLCSQLGSTDQAAACRARRELVVRSAAPENERAAFAAELAECLTARAEKKKDDDNPPLLHSATARKELCRALADVGGDPQIPALVEALADFEVREMARYALDRIPTHDATAALIEVLPDSVGVEFRVGVLNALGRRHDPEVRKALLAATEEPNQEVRLAAAEGLAQQADPAADAVLVALGKDLSGKDPHAEKRMAVARLQLAATLAAAGQTDAARSIYRAITSDGADEAQRKAAKTALEQLG